MNIITYIRQLNVSLNDQTRLDLVYQWVRSKSITRKEFGVLLLHIRSLHRNEHKSL